MDMESRGEMGAGGQAEAKAEMNVGGLTFVNTYRFEAHDKDGNLLWVEEVHNLVTTEGKNDALSKYFKGSSYTAAWYVGLTGASPTFAAADVMNSHGGWTEVTAYSEGARQTLTLGTPASGSVDNSASKATFTINADGTALGGGFVTSNSTKGGTTGTLYGGAAFSGGNKTLGNTDTLTVTVTLTQS
jgi:hypothetical protein